MDISTEKTRIEKDTCTPIFIAALFTIARTWTRSKCPSIGEWIKKLWYICISNYYSVLKRNAFASVVMRWINLEPIIQSEVSQKEKEKYCLAWKIPWTEEPGGLQSMGLLRGGDD